MKRFAWLAPLLLLFAAACHNGGSSQNTTNVRLLHAVADSEPLDMLVDTNAKISAVALGTTSASVSIDSGTHEIQMRSSTNAAILYDKSLQFGSGSNYTLVTFGKRAAMNTLQLVDDTTAPDSGKTKIRFIGLSPDVGAVDVYVVTGDVSTQPATGASVAYQSASDFLQITPGTFNVTFTTAGTKDILFQSAPQTFAANTVYTIGVFPASGGKLVNAVLITSGGGGLLLSNPAARIKAVNALPDSTNINFKANGTILLSAVPFAGASTYVNLTAGTPTLQIEQSGIPGTNIATLAATIGSANDYTMIALGTIASPKLVALTDDNTVPATGFAKVRFINALTTAGNVDVLVNFAGQAAGIAQGAASTYASLPPRTDYVFTFATPGGVNTIASISNQTVEAGAVYDLYLLGTLANPQAKLARSR